MIEDTNGHRGRVPGEPETADHDDVVPGAPSDNDNLTGILADLAAKGYDDEIYAVAGGQVRWRACGHVMAAADLEIGELRRLEGASDPADTLAVYAVRCPACAQGGALVLHYGPMASEEEADVLVALPETT